jgi:pimeloyl-ACP methyl ester carboxylesterase
MRQVSTDADPRADAAQPPWRTRSGALVAVLLVCAATFLPSCTLWKLSRQYEKAERWCEMGGTVATEEPRSSNPLVVVLVRVDGERLEEENWSIVDHYVLERAGRWRLTMTAGRYALAAFEDLNADLRYQPGEPVLTARGSPIYELNPGDSRLDFELRIPSRGGPVGEMTIDIAEFQARSFRDQRRATLGQVSAEGEVVQLSDARFDPENGKKGLWAPVDFGFDVGPGIYFLEQYDPERIPVLFVHGIAGSPREFESLSRGLDREHFQAWFAYYPSGFNLEPVGAYLAQLVIKLRLRHGFTRIAVVAHSMGGLVSRSFIQQHHAASDRDTVELFVSIATPWGGFDSARKGVERSPVVVRSWRDVEPDSEFLNGLFFEDPDTRRVRLLLPKHVAYHLMSAYKRDSLLPGPSDDRVVPLSSALRFEAWEEAKRLWPFDEDHTGILSSPEVASRLSTVLETELGER